MSATQFEPNVGRKRLVKQPELNRRNFLASATALGLGVPLLNGCARGSGGDGETLGQVDMSVPDAYKNRDTDIVVWSAFSGPNGDAFERAVDGFNSSQDSIYAQVQFQGGYGESASKLTAAVQAGAVPDVQVMADTYWGRFLLDDILQPLGDYVDGGLERDNFLERLYDEGVANDQLYWLSFARSTPLFYYNRDVFEELGLPDRGPDSWDELEDWAEEFATIDVEGRPLKAIALHSKSDFYFQARAWQFGGHLSDQLDLTIDSDAVVNAAQWEQDAVQVSEFAVVSDEGSGAFANGVTACLMDSTGLLTTIDDEAEFTVGASPLPTEPNVGIPTGGAGLAVPANIGEERVAAAVELMKYLSSAEVAAQWTVDTGYVPIVKDAMDVPVLADKIADDTNYEIAVDQLASAEGGDHVRMFVPNATEEIVASRQLYLTDGSTDVRDVLGDLAAELDSRADEVRDRYEEYFGG